MKCGSSMFCSAGKCYKNGDCVGDSCTTTEKTSSSVIIVAIVVPIGVCFLITIFCVSCLRRRKYYQSQRREVPIPYRGNVNNVNQNQAVIMQNQQMQNNQNNNGYPAETKYYQQGMVQQGIPIDSVVLPNGQPYFPNDAAKQENYAIHQSHMGGEGSGYNQRVYGQPPQNFPNAQGYNNMGQPYMAGYQYPIGMNNNYNNNNNGNLWIIYLNSIASGDY